MDRTPPPECHAVRRRNRIRAAKAVVAAGVALATIAAPAILCDRCAAPDELPNGLAQRRTAMFLTLNWYNAEVDDVSMVQLLATPERFHGKRVRLTGFVHFAFEANGIYLHKEDFDQLIMNDALWIDRPAGSRLNDVYVLVEGRFRADDRGHMGLYSGTLTDVTRMELGFAEVLRNMADGGAR